MLFAAILIVLSYFWPPVDSVVCFIDTYPLDSDLSSG